MNPYTKKFDKIKQLAKLYPKLEDLGFELTAYDEKIIVKINKLSHLSQARQLIKQSYLNWKDKIDQVWEGTNNIILTSYGDKNHPLIEIWLSSTVNEYPKELLKDGCHFEKFTSENYRLVCSA